MSTEKPERDDNDCPKCGSASCSHIWERESETPERHIMLRCPHCNEQYEAKIDNNPLVKDGLTITPIPIEVPLESESEQ